MRSSSISRALSRGEFAPRDLSRGARTPGHARPQAPWAVSNELLASLAIIGLVCTVLFGAIGALSFIGATGLLILQQPARNLRQILVFAPLLLIPMLAIISTVWSPVPASTMRSGLQLLLTCVAAIVIARNLRPERMILALFLGYVAICLSILPGVPASLSSGAPLTSPILGSKNQVGFSAYMLATLGFAVLIDSQQHRFARWFAIFAFPLALLLIYLAQSGGGTSSLLLAAIIVPSLALLGRLNFGGRIAILLFCLGCVAIAIVFRADIESMITTFRTETLKKDATLTGRTYLWAVADRLAAERPWLGLGYASFWQQGNLEAEGLWRYAGIANRYGFNFHNSFVAMRVELGWVGEALLWVTCAVVAIAGLVRQFLRPTPAMACLLGLLFVSYSRSYVEEGLVGPFSMITITWLATLIYAVAPKIVKVRTSAVGDRRRRTA